MYQQGCHVVYGIHGVCIILEPEIRRVDRKNVEYYVLQPLDQPETRYYVPTQSAAAVSKMKPVLSMEELDQLLLAAGNTATEWIADENGEAMICCGLGAPWDGNATTGTAWFDDVKIFEASRKDAYSAESEHQVVVEEEPVVEEVATEEAAQ